MTATALGSLPFRFVDEIAFDVCPLVPIPKCGLRAVTGSGELGRTIGKYAGAFIGGGAGGGLGAAAGGALFSWTGPGAIIGGAVLAGALGSAGGAAGYDIGGNIGDAVENGWSSFVNNVLTPHPQIVPSKSRYA